MFLGRLMIAVIFFTLGATCASAGDKMYDKLGLESKQEHPVIADEQERKQLVKQWSKKLAKLDDRRLGDVKDKVSDASQLLDLQHDVESILKMYRSHVRDILLNNVKFERKGDVARDNQSNLALLSFPTKYNHKTKNPIGGILHYEQNISDSIFSREMVDAGLLVNYPDLEHAEWVQDAINMQNELRGFQRLHMAYIDGIKFISTTVHEINESAVTIDTTQNESLPDFKRERIVREFINSVLKLKQDETSTSFKKHLVEVLATYENKVKPILVNNVNMKRKDVAAESNKGELVKLFYIRSNPSHKKKPISDIIPTDIRADKVVQKALVMESELKTLFEEHKDYLIR